MHIYIIKYVERLGIDPILCVFFTKNDTTKTHKFQLIVKTFQLITDY